MRDNNRRAFEKAVVKIQKTFSGTEQVEIIDPHDIAEEVDRRFSEANRTRYHALKPKWADYMKPDLKKFLDADCVYFLTGWEKSRGAALERHIAEALEIPFAETVKQLCDIYTESKNKN
jgi:hypothetical protein